jgi:hypothetical protein
MKTKNFNPRHAISRHLELLHRDQQFSFWRWTD